MTKKTSKAFRDELYRVPYSEPGVLMSLLFRKPYFHVVDEDGIVHFTGIQDKGRPNFNVERVSACHSHTWEVPWQPERPFQRSGKDVTCLGCLANMPQRR